MPKADQVQEREDLIKYLCSVTLSGVSVLEMVRFLSTRKDVQEDKDLNRKVKKILQIAES